MTHFLVAVLAAAGGWCWGHSTARIRHIPIGATAAQDQHALDTADWGSWLCCATAITSSGVEHDPTCTTHRSAA
ncbi:hypothetical protein [Streptomyces sp. AD55]|uniref:hypothetical protein n=1 Tax=Streptomyces sp. AD55 TaxID=3242895 RepID=UPI003528B399